MLSPRHADAQIKALGPRLTGSVEVESDSIREVGGYPGYTVLRAICNPHVTQQRKRTQPFPAKSLRRLVPAAGIEPATY